MEQQLAAIVKKAGAFLLQTKETGHREKTNKKDFVTVADIKSQNILQTELNKAFPAIPVVSEEHDAKMRQALTGADFTGFVIDPIDGTYNFKRDMRESAISIGYIQKGEPKVGAVFDPYKNELYLTTKGKGATRNGKTIKVSNQAEIASASIATSNSYNDAAMARNLRRHLGIYEQTGMIPWTSCPGSGVLIMTYVACGRFDAYHHNGLKPWDNAAAFLIIRESGGVVKDLMGNDAHFTGATVLTGNPTLVAKLQAVFNKLDKSWLT